MTNMKARPVRGIAAVALAALAALALAGCAPTPGSASGTTPTAGQASSVSGSSTQAAAAVTVTTIDETTLTVPSGRPAALFFFTVGCGACVPGGQALAQARQQAAGKADFLLVDLDPSEPRDAVEYFRQTTGDPTMPVVTTGAVDLAQRWKVTQLSTAVVIDKSGTVAYRAVEPSAQDLLAAIDRATG